MNFTNTVAVDMKRVNRCLYDTIYHDFYTKIEFCLYFMVNIFEMISCISIKTRSYCRWIWMLCSHHWICLVCCLV